jgi:dihydrofolate synthase / folylpolyglutamate synthase
MNFEQSVSYLQSLGNEVLAMKLGLRATRVLLRSLGDPQKEFYKVQIAGTNGKGSTAAFVDAMCRSAGVRAGLYTSPHLVSITERIRVNGVEISESGFALAATRVRDSAERLVRNGILKTVPTFFEQVTAAAMLAFRAAKIEIAVLETGLGGRFDSVTATEAEMGAITRVDLDHQNILGETIVEIANEKAAIIRPGMNVIVGRQVEAVDRVIRDRCAVSGVAPATAILKFEISERNPEDGSRGASNGNGENARELNGEPRTLGCVVSFKSKKAEYVNIGLSLAGKHQIENAETAITIAEQLQNHFAIAAADIIAGLHTASHFGRLEIYKGVLLDGAHNIGGAHALRQFLDENVAKPVTMIFGAMRDKSLRQIGSILFPVAAHLIFTRVDNSRSADPEQVSGDFPYRALTSNSAAEALRMARHLGTQNLICVTGSLYLVGEVRKILQNER